MRRSLSTLNSTTHIYGFIEDFRRCCFSLISRLQITSNTQQRQHRLLLLVVIQNGILFRDRIQRNRSKRHASLIRLLFHRFLSPNTNCKCTIRCSENTNNNPLPRLSPSMIQIDLLIPPLFFRFSFDLYVVERTFELFVFPFT